ncbi:MAG TPA: hypothetical protein VLF62_04385, partial [Candidatus Saccharimonadales bacterium]|nr:hypothetical protein [Candidatus Saccharimonadales bacterium]
MFEHTLFFIYKFRHAFVVPLALLILTLTSALVTALGSNTVLAAKTYPHNSTMGASVSDPNFVTDGFSRMMENGERDMVVAGMGVYRACKSVTNTSIRGSRAMAHGTAVAAVGTWHGVAFVGRGIGSGMLFAVRGVGNGLLFTVRGIGSGIMLTLRSIGSAGLFVLRAPGKVVGSVAHAPVNAIIKPPDDKIAPVISSETSAAILTRFNAQQQQQIAALLADQVAANKQ